VNRNCATLATLHIFWQTLPLPFNDIHYVLLVVFIRHDFTFHYLTVTLRFFISVILTSTNLAQSEYTFQSS